MKGMLVADTIVVVILIIVVSPPPASESSAVCFKFVSCSRAEAPGLAGAQYRGCLAIPDDGDGELRDMP